MQIPETGKILFDDEHWALRANKHDLHPSELSKTANIGNIMNITRLKPDATNSESTASSVASRSSDVINTIDKNSIIASEINKEMDKLFGPALERASSGDDLKVIAPLRHKKRQFRSQEVLFNNEMSIPVQSNNLANTLPTQSEACINDVPSTEKLKVPHIPILHENQRAEIVASVTERLYTKLKKKEDAAVSKVESIVDRKIIEPLSELKICTNARQRLMELSQKATRNRRRIGIPAHTQTRITATRVKDQAVDVQTDLDPYISRNSFSHTFYRDVATETVPMTPRCKEIAVGPTGSLDSIDISTETKRVLYKNSFVMTDIVTKNERFTQTLVVPPPRRKKRAILSNHVRSKENCNVMEECSAAPVISINISQVYPVDAESQSSDDNSEKLNTTTSKSSVATATPDLLTNHSTIDPQNIIDIREDEISVIVNVAEDTKVPFIIQNANDRKSTDNIKHMEDFPDTDDFTLPRVSPNSVRKVNSNEIKNMILGRNENIYPYNIILSPQKERDTKRIVKFKDTNTDQTDVIISEISKESENNDNNTKNESETASDMTTSEKDFPVDKEYESIYSDSTESSKVETDSFIWKEGGSRTMGSLKRSNYVPVYKSTKYKTAKARVVQDFLGIEPDGNENGISYQKARDLSSSDSRDTDNAEHKSRRRTPYFDYKPYYNHNNDYDHEDITEFHNIEKKLLDSCGILEDAVKKYENNITSYKESMKNECVETTIRKPKEYLKHLVQLRREVVKAESENTDSSLDLAHK